MSNTHNQLMQEILEECPAHAGAIAQALSAVYGGGGILVTSQKNQPPMQMGIHKIIADHAGEAKADLIMQNLSYRRIYIITNFKKYG